MEWTQAVILGGIQGLTEFFPVSSSGHLVIFQQLMGLTEPVLMFDISVHVGTLAAIVLYYFKDIIRIFGSLAHWSAHRLRGQAETLSKEQAGDVRLAWLIIIGSIPTAVIGFGLNKISHVLFSSLTLVGISLMITAGVVLATRWIKPEKGAGSDFSVKKAFLIGIVQGLAVIPGISRSGSTIATALFIGIDRETAARYSFLLSIPAIFGALLLQVFTDSAGAGNLSAGVIATGLITSLIVGYAALSLLVKIVQNGRLYLFAPYCFLLAGIALIAAG